MVDNERSGEDFESFFRRVLPRAIKLAERVTFDHGAAEDAAVETLAIAYSRWSRVAALPWRDAWTLKVCLHKSFRHRPQPVPEIVPVEQIDHAETVVLREALQAELVRLPRRQRDAIALRYLADMSEIEVADAVGVSQGSVKTERRQPCPDCDSCTRSNE
jgi:RNA polymerase sigma factor (sigma-70 family)